MTSSAASMLQVIRYEPEHQPWFEKLNRDWIEKFFRMEPIDFEVLQHPDEQIIKPGGAIFMGIFEKEIVGTVAVKKIESRTFEFTKMAVDEKYQGKQIGKAIAQSALSWCRDSGAEKIILYSNTKLTAALQLYRKLGFKEIPLDAHYERSDIKMELIF